MSNEKPQFDDFLAQAAESEGFGVNHGEPTNDPNESIHKGLEKLYYKYLQQIEKRLVGKLIDSQKATDLANQVLALAEKDGVRHEINYTPAETAKEIMGVDSYFGPEEIRSALEIEMPEQLPIIPFSPEELERAKELNQFLILRINQTADGQPLTMNKIAQIAQPIFHRKQLGRVVNIHESVLSDDFYTNETPNMEWALTSRYCILDSTDKDYLEQTQVLINYLVRRVYTGLPLPKIYKDAIAEFAANRATIQKLLIFNRNTIMQDRRAASQKLSDLSITKLLRPSPVEILYDHITQLINTNEAILGPCFTWTKGRSDSGFPIRIGTNLGDSGAFPHGTVPEEISDTLGAIFSRGFVRNES